MWEFCSGLTANKRYVYSSLMRAAPPLLLAGHTASPLTYSDMTEILIEPLAETANTADTPSAPYPLTSTL